MNALRILCLAVMVYQGLCCTKKNPTSKGNVWQRMVGKDITTSPYNGNDNPVETGNELNCDFESGGCCWSNASPPSDQLDYVLVQGPTEAKKMQSSFGTQSPPSGSAIGVGTETAASDGSAQTAQLYSCPITCADGSITVNVRHWQTKDVTIQVCTETDPAGPPTNCRTLSGASGSVDSVSLPGGQNVRVVIVARGFTAAGGSVAMIDDINVQSKTCPTTTTTTTTTTVATTTVSQSSTLAPAVCKALACNFEQGNTCSYQNSAAAGGNKQWAAVQAPFQNLLTGIKYAAEGKYMAAVYLNPGDSASMATSVNFPAGTILQFQGYRATEGIDLMACCDTTSNCPFSTTKNVQSTDYRSWKAATVTCPAGTRQIVFKATNHGTNYGAAGVDNIQVLSEVDKSPLC